MTNSILSTLTFHSGMSKYTFLIVISIKRIIPLFEVLLGLKNQHKHKHLLLKRNLVGNKS